MEELLDCKSYTPITGFLTFTSIYFTIINDLRIWFFAAKKKPANGTLYLTDSNKLSVVRATKHNKA